MTESESSPGAGAPTSSPTPAAGTNPEPPRSRRGLFLPAWVAFPLALVAIAAVGFSIGWISGSGSSNQSSTATSTQPTIPSDAASSSLSKLGLMQSDVVASPLSLALIPGGDQVSGQPTLDLCNGKFPSEALRTARLQVVALDRQGNAALSTEAVLYRKPSATEQSFHELESVAAQCPATPVVSPIGEPTIITKFNAGPDSSWPQVATVDRLAYDFVTTDASGRSQHSIAVYLRRGRVLMGVYFAQPDTAIPAIGGQNTTSGIVDLFAQRIAQLPASVVNG
ncbi:MAG: hypothetical protein ACHQIG_11240 [Acidimicrobiia bacterium]